MLAIRSEKKAERSDKGRYFTERTYGAFERRIPLEDVEEGRGVVQERVLTMSLPKSENPRAGIKRIAINTAAPSRCRRKRAVRSGQESITVRSSRTFGQSCEDANDASTSGRSLRA